LTIPIHVSDLIGCILPLSRICDSQSNIWRPPKAEHEAEAVVGSTVERELKPLTELESFRGVEFDWYANGTRREEGDDDVGDSASVCTAVSKRSRGGGGGGKRRRSMISSVLHSFSQKVKNIVSEPPSSPSLSFLCHFWQTSCKFLRLPSHRV
jgi:hypothetical protein